MQRLTFNDRIVKRAGGLLVPLWLAMAFCAGTAKEAQGQAPPNDNLANAQAIVGSTGVVYGDNINATAETNEPAPYIVPPQATIWYLWTAPVTTTMDFSTRYSTDTNGNELGTIMAIYQLSGSNLNYSNMTLVASNEYDPSAGVTNGLVTSRVDFPVAVGQEYLIQVDGSTNTPDGSIDEGYVQLNWAPSQVGGTFTFSVLSTGTGNRSANAYFAGEHDDGLFDVGCEPQTIDPSLHNVTGTNNIRITVVRQGGYTGKCEVTLMTTNSYYQNNLRTNYIGTNTYITNFDTNGFGPADVLSFTNIFVTNIASENDVEDFIDFSGFEDVTYIPVYAVSTATLTNADGLLSSLLVSNFSSLTGLAVQTNFWQNFPFPAAGGTTIVTNGSVVTVTTTQSFYSNYNTTSLAVSASNNVDYVPYSNTLVFNDFQMSQDVYLQINPQNAALVGPDWPDASGKKLYNGINPVVVLTLTNAVLDPNEDPDIIPPTISENGSNTFLGILTFKGNPFSGDLGGPYLTTNANQCVTLNFERTTFRVNRPAAAVPPNIPPSSNTVYLYAILTGTPGNSDTYTVNYTIDCSSASSFLNVPAADSFRWNGFPSVAGSDYAVSSHYGVTDYDFSDPIASSGNLCGAAIDPSSWSGNYGTLTFGPPSSGVSRVAEIPIPIYNWGATEFDVDLFVQLFHVASSNPNLSASVPGFIGNIASANLTINYSGIEPGGAYDVSFNPDSSVTASYPPSNTQPGANPPPPDGGVVKAVAIQPADGKAVIGGFFTSYDTTPVYSIARLQTNGWLDTTFNNVLDGGVNGFVTAIVIDTNGNIIIGGSFSSYDGNLVGAPNIARLTPSGALDTNFNTGIGFNSSVYALAIDTNGNILVGGDFTSYNTTNCNHVARLLPNGALDTTFLPDTANGLTNYGADGDVRAVATDGNGNIILGGDFSYVDGYQMSHLARLLSSGALDTTFNIGDGPDDSVYSVAVAPNNEIVIGGAFQYYNLASSSGVALIAYNGALDTTFPVGTGADGNVYCVTLDTNGNVLVGGQFRNFNTTRRLGLARLLPNGWVDTSFMDTSYNQFAGLINTYYSASTDPVHIANSLAVQPDGNIIVGGSFTNIGGGTARNAIHTQINVTRLIGASTPGPQTGGGGIGNCPGNITLTQNPYTVNDTGGKLFVTLQRTNGSLGPAQVTLGTNTLAPGPGSAGAADFGLILPAMPLYNSFYYALNGGYITPYGTYAWRVSDGFYGNNTSIQPGNPTGQTDVNLNLNIYDNLAAQQNLLASLSLLNITELNITTNAGGVPPQAGPLMLGGVVIPTFPALGMPGAALEIINNNFPVGFVGFSSTNYTAINTSNSVTITVVRTNGSYGPVSVTYFTANGTALAGSNYTAISLAQNKTLNFSGGPNNNTATFSVPILNKSTLQSTKYFKLILTNASPLGVFDTNIPPILASTSTVTIIDGNFQPGHLCFTSPTYSVTKGGIATIGVERIGGALGQLTVQCATSDFTASNGVNYVGITNTLSWSNQDISVKTITIPTLQDHAVDGNLAVNLTLFNATNVGSPNNDSLILFPPSTATLTIVESDSYGNLNFAAPPSSGVPNFNILQNSGQAVITVVRTGGATGTITANYATFNDTNPPAGLQTALAGTNYGATNGTLTLGPGVTSASFVVPIYYTPAESVVTNRVVTLALVTGSSNISGQFPQYATLTILDPQLILSPAGAVDTSTLSGTGFNGFVNSLSLQPDGSLLAGGDFTFFNQYPFEYVARLNPNGSFDSSFLLDQAGANSNIFQVLSQITNSGQTNNGPIMVAGSFTSVDGVTRNGISRLNIGGSMDETFNPGSGADSTVFAIVETLLPTGVTNQTNIAYYVGGNFANFNGVPSGGITRLNGSLGSPGYQGGVDPNFNVGQGVTSANGAIHALAVQADNSVIAGGDFTAFNSLPCYHLVRLNSAGVVDPTFNPGTGSDPSASVRAVVIQPDGRILVGGSFTNVTVSNVTYNLNYLARLNTDGSVDTNFNVGVGGNNSVLALALDSQQRIIVGGGFTRFSGVTRSGITRLNSDGTVDATVNFGSGADGGFVDTIVIQSNDEMDLGGGFSSFEGLSENNFVRLFGGSTPGDGEIQFSVAIYGVLQNGTNAAVTLQRLGGEGTVGRPPATIVVSTSDGTALAGTDYRSLTTNVTFPLGETFQTVYVPLINNETVSSNKFLNLSLSNPTNTIIGPQASAILIITNVNTAVQFSATSYRDSANVPSGYASIPVVRTGNLSGTATVMVSTGTSGSATPYVNYIPESTTLVFNPGVTTLYFNVPLLNATNMFSDLTVDLELGYPTGALPGSPTSATLTIANVFTGPGVLAFSQTNYVVSEGATNAFITIVRSNGSSGPVSVTLTTSNGTAIAGQNYLGVNSTLNFADGVTNQAVAIPVIQMPFVGPDATVYLTLSNPQPAPNLGGPTIGGSNQEILTIQNDIENFSFGQPSYTISEGTALSISVVRGGPASDTASVSYYTYSPPNASENNGFAVPGVDYIPVSGTLIYASNGLQSIPIAIPQSNVVYGPLTFQIYLDNPNSTNNSPTGVQVLAPNPVTVTILSDLTAFEFSTSAYTVGENGTNVVITVDRNTSTPAASVQFATSNGTNQNSALNAVNEVDYITTNGVLNFPSGVSSTNFTVSILNPNLVESNKTFNLALFNPLVNLTTNGYLVAPSNATVTITNIASGVSFASPTLTVSACDALAVIPVVISGATNNAVSVFYSTTNGTASAGTNYFATNGVLSFAPGQTSANVFVQVINDHIVGVNPTVLLYLSNPTNAQLLNPSMSVLTLQGCNGTTNFVVNAFASSAIMVWDTPVPATVQVDYGTNASYGNVTYLSGPSTHHVVLLTGLARDTTYYFNAMSWEGGILYQTPGSFATVDTLILNTGDAAYFGLWKQGAGSMPGIYGSYFNDTPTTQYNPTAGATYTPTIPTPGFYNVFAWYPTDSTFSTNAQMFVSGATNVVIASVNQTTNGGSWQPLATNLYFANGTSGNVIVYNDTGESNKLVAANAMMWSYIPSQDYPSNGVPPAWWSTFYFGTNTAAAASNYIDYVFGTPPGASPTNVPSFWVGLAPSNSVTVSFAPSQGGRVYQLQTTTNLSTANWLTLPNQPLWQTNGVGVFTITESNAIRCFYRLSASVVPQ
jgi:uncharacterized delta-60 repeat protein